MTEAVGRQDFKHPNMSGQTISKRQTSTGRYRPDIDGLRALAVSAVVFYHADPDWLPAGYIGVDVFFVLSGYLIGGIVYSAALKGNFSFLNFYARRARRILPALIALLAFVSCVGLLFFNSREMMEFATQSLAALGGFSNFYFWKHTDYFATHSAYEPLLMTWSLGVEEQFYFVFPIFILLLARLKEWWRLVAIFAAAFVSLGLSLYLTTEYPISAFYMLPARAWELAAGVLLAVIHHDKPRTKETAGLYTDVAAYSALAALLASILIFDDETPFPGWAALIPVVATVVLIQTRHSAVNRHLLGTSAFVFVGLISYSWYLWHWPLMALVRRASDVPPSGLQMLWVVLCSFVLAVLSWRFIERPFRHSKAGDAKTLLHYGAVVTIAAIPLVTFRLGDGLPSRLDASVEQALQQGRGTCRTSYGSAALPDDPRCMPEGATIALIGDSHASALGPGLVEAADERGMRVRQVTKSACAPLIGFSFSDTLRPRHASQCAAFLDKAFQSVLEDREIDTIVIAARWPELDDKRYVRIVDDGFSGPVMARTAITEGLNSIAKMANAHGKKLVIVADVPSFDFDPFKHMVGESLSLRRLMGVLFDGARRVPPSVVGTDRVANAANARRETVKAAVEALSSAIFFDPYLQLCDRKGCRYSDGDQPIYIDSHHLSGAGSRMIDWSSALEEPKGVSVAN